MPLIQERNASAQELGSADHLNVQDRNWGAEWYDHAGGQSFQVGGGPFTLNLDTEKLNSAPSVFTLASDIVTITEAGLYLFTFQLMAIQNGGSSACVNHLYLEQDPATGVFATYLPATTYFPMAPISSSVSTGNVVSLVQVGINYRYRIRFEQSYGSSPLLTVADGSKLSIVRLFKNG